MTNERSLKTSEIPTVDVMVERCLSKYALAIADDQCYQKGYNWYPNAHIDCIRAVGELNQRDIFVSLDLFTKIVAIISPGRRWELNIRDAYVTCLAYQRRDIAERIEILSNHRVARRNGIACFVRAWRLLDGDYSIVYKKSPKAFSFADNLLYPHTSLAVTIDQHNCHIVLGEDDIEGSIGIAYGQYRKLECPMRHTADILGLPPRTLQSILWQWRKDNLAGLI